MQLRPRRSTRRARRGCRPLPSGAQSILLGESRSSLAGGIESMSRMPYLVDAADARWGHKMGHFQFVDAMYRDGFSCPLSGLIMGETAEMLARQYGITRAESDAFALESQQQGRGRADGRAASTPRSRRWTMTERGKTDRRCAPTSIRGPAPRSRRWRKLPLTFPNVEGHAGHHHRRLGVGHHRRRRRRGAELRRSGRSAPACGRWRDCSAGPAPASIRASWASARCRRCRSSKARTGLRVDDVDLVELNEAFAAQVLAVLRDVPIAPEKLNVNGGAIALGHPIGCTGARIVVTLLHELRRRGGSRGHRDAVRQRRHGHGDGRSR